MKESEKTTMTMQEVATLMNRTLFSISELQIDWITAQLYLQADYRQPYYDHSYHFRFEKVVSVKLEYRDYENIDSNYAPSLIDCASLEENSLNIITDTFNLSFKCISTIAVEHVYPLGSQLKLQKLL